LEINIKTNRQEFTLVVTLITDSEQDLRIILKDTDLPNTLYTNRILTINGKRTILIQVPLCNINAKLIIYNEKTKNIPKYSDGTFRLVDKPFMIPLEKRYDLIDYNETGLASFLKFAQKFCINAGWMRTGNYRSDDGRYFIEFLPDIISSEPPYLPLNTSSRIAKDNGVIQVSQVQFEPMTVPMRLVILCHEFAHYFVNKNIEDETEADLNGLNIYLGLGYPRIDAKNAFIDAFMGADYHMNMERMQVIQDFIDHYDNNQILIKP